MEAMEYVALLRGINVGTSVKVRMADLKVLFEQAGCSAVSTYINSGNVCFAAAADRAELAAAMELKLRQHSGVDIRVLVKTKAEICRIAAAIPAGWLNDSRQKTDVAYLFDTVDQAGLLETLPVKREFVQLLQVEGALIWNVQRDMYHKSQLNKLASHRLYQEMTVRNVNTARYLASC